MRIALVSDSHGSIDRLNTLLENLKNAGIKHLLHTGDFAERNVCEILAKYSEIEIHISLGNSDINAETISDCRKLPHCTIDNVVSVKIGNLKFALSHIEGVAQSQIKDADIYCHGHTHCSKVEHRDGKLVLNPGALCEDGRYFLIDLDKPKIVSKLFLEKI